MKRISIVFALVTLLAVSAVAQNSTTGTDQSSLADYARKVRKDPTSKAKPKVYDNDNLPTEDKLSVVGAPATADAQTNAGKPGSDGQAKDDQAKNEQEWKDWQDKMTTQKSDIDLASRELDVLQKEYQLRAAAMYADAGNRLRNSGDWDKQDADYKQKIADKQKAVDDAKQKLDDMQEQARKDGVPASVREQTAPSNNSEQ
ncbi:MAG TPA: hypothetical protein VGG14_17160 [Candidatus Sulfotelmatobacter sp.]